MQEGKVENPASCLIKSARLIPSFPGVMMMMMMMTMKMIRKILMMSMTMKMKIIMKKMTMKIKPSPVNSGQYLTILSVYCMWPLSHNMAKAIDVRFLELEKIVVSVFSEKLDIADGPFFHKLITLIMIMFGLFLGYSQYHHITH